MPHPIDIAVGQRVTMARQLAGMSQETLGHRLDVSFQQVQKYEKGSNRISASKLALAAIATGVPVAWFFEAMPDGVTLPTGRAAPRNTSIATGVLIDTLPEDVRKGAISLIRSLANQTQTAAPVAAE